MDISSLKAISTHSQIETFASRGGKASGHREQGGPVPPEEAQTVLYLARQACLLSFMTKKI